MVPERDSTQFFKLRVTVNQFSSQAQIPHRCLLHASYNRIYLWIPGHFSDRLVIVVGREWDYNRLSR